MTDDPPAADPPRATPTADWLAEQRAKNRAYEEGRKRHAREWFRRGEPEPDSEPEGAAEPAAGGRARRPARGKIHDKRQGSLDV